MGDTRAARKDFHKAYGLASQFPDLAAGAAAGDIAAGDSAAGDQILRAVFGTTTVDDDNLEYAYYLSKNWPRYIALWKLRAGAANAPAEAWFSLANAYALAGDKDNAINVINRAVRRYPGSAAEGADFIRQMEGGDSPGATD
jgi:tetratricopeptide (TPR) repeat protein